MGTGINPEDRKTAIKWARDVVENNLIIVDTETTGIDSGDEIIQIAAVNFDLSVAFSQLFVPIVPINPNATKVHGKTWDGLIHTEGVLQWGTFYPRLYRMLNGQRAIAYNTGFDGRLVTQTNNLRGLNDFEVQWECAMLQYAAFYQEPHWNNPDQYRWHKLVDACRRHGLAADIMQNAHDALADVQMTRVLIQYMAEQDL